MKMVAIVVEKGYEESRISPDVGPVILNKTPRIQLQRNSNISRSISWTLDSDWSLTAHYGLLFLYYRPLLWITTLVEAEIILYQ